MNVFQEIKDLEFENNKIRSKSMFNDDFFGQIKTLVEHMQDMIQEQIIPNYKIEYTSY